MTNIENRHDVPKRRLISAEECSIDLKPHLPTLFIAFKEARMLYEKEIRQTPPQARARSLEANLLNSKIIQSIQKYFPKNWFFGKYKRFILYLDGYNIFVKKLNGKNMPMNVKTRNDDAIKHQAQLSLFDDETDTSDPILFFGYQKSPVGEILDAKLVYVDENRARWTITDADIDHAATVRPIPTTKPESPVRPTVRIKEAGKAKKTGTD